jgi:hypothetical protein
MKSYIILIKVLLISLTINAQSDSVLYSFFIAGHTFGQLGVNNIGLHPPFKEKFVYIQSRPEIHFGVFTGDIVSQNPTAQDWDEVDADIDTLGLPVYFAVGNHDMENRPLFESRYGDTYYNFTYKNDLFIVLDPNIDEWNISGTQLEFLKNTIDSNYQSVENIYVFFHQLLCWESDNIYKNVIPNSFAGRADTINFWTEVEPLFHQLPNKIIMFMGDFGAASWSDDVMYDLYDNISFVGSGMGEGIGDNFVIINVKTDKTIDYDLICLNDSINCLGELTDYAISINNIDLFTTLKVKLYPNPANNFITIELDDTNETIIQLYNVNGQLILQKNTKGINKEYIDLTSLSNGLYLVKIISKVNQTNIKLAIQ